jgi:hypothetical protein
VDTGGQQRARVAVGEAVQSQLRQSRERLHVDLTGVVSLASVSLASRSAKTSATRSAASRRDTKARTCADAWSSHCASSTRQSRGPSSATSASTLSAANPTRNMSGAVPLRSPSATPRAAC